MRLFAVLVAFLIPVNSAIAQVPTIEREALIALYNATDGANWDTNSNWRNGGDTGFNDLGTECSWTGVVCAGGTNVTNLTLDLNKLSGSIPPELGNLSSLTDLSLALNQLSGSIPPELGSLSSLMTLDLYYSQLSGSIPPELGRLSNLQRLYLQGNQLSGSIPPELGNLSSLQYLNLEKNRLSGSIPAELGNLSSLQSLQLKINNLSGSIPAELGNLSSLTMFSLTLNKLSGSIPPELGNLSSLWTLHLSSNKLSGSIPAELGNLSYLRDLRLDSNNLSGSIPAELGNLSNVHHLYLASNKLSGSIPAELRNLSSLAMLLLTSNELSGSIPPELGNLSSLEILNLESNKLSGSIPPELENISRLQFLSLYDNQLSGEIPLELMNLRSLRELHICKNSLFTKDAVLQAWLDSLEPGWDACQAEGTERFFFYWIEIAAHNEGQAGSVWRTDVVTRNTSSSPAVTEYTLHTASGDHKLTGSTLGPAAQGIYEDIVGLMGVDGKGALEIWSNRTLKVASRIYNQTDDGTFGQYVRAYAAGEEISAGETVELLGLRQQEDVFRTNISVTNTSEFSATVMVELFRTDGAMLHSYFLNVPAGMVVQDPEPFDRRANSPDLGWGYAMVSVTSGSGILTSASVIDSRTNDATTVLMMR